MAVHLTQEQGETLGWATNAEANFARNLIRWNSDSFAN
ncbi:DUF6753 family protein [Microcoleus sp. D2_18a_D3]